MEELFLIRQRLIGIYKLNEDKINIACKFLAGIITFLLMSYLSAGNLIGTKKLIIVLLGGIFASVSSPAVFLAVAAVATVIFIASASVETAVAALIFFFLLYVFYGRVFPKESLLFVAMLVCFKFKVPYAVAFLGGIYFGGKAIFPVAAAMFTNQITPIMQEFIKMSPAAEFSASTMPDVLFNMYTYIFSEAGMAVISGSFYAAAAMVLAVVTSWAISSAHIDHEKEIAIIASAIVTVIAMFLAVIIGGSKFSVVGLPFFVLLSAVIAFIIRLFDDLPDYRHTERVRFQDKNYIYYVKAVPKMKMPPKERDGSED